MTYILLSVGWVLCLLIACVGILLGMILIGDWKELWKGSIVLVSGLLFFVLFLFTAHKTHEYTCATNYPGGHLNSAFTCVVKVGNDEFPADRVRVWSTDSKTVVVEKAND